MTSIKFQTWELSNDSYLLEQQGDSDDKPIRRLLAAILSRAIIDLFDSNEKVRLSARRFIFCEINFDVTDGFSFDEICDALEINANTLRLSVNIPSTCHLITLRSKKYNRSKLKLSGSVSSHLALL